ncbi:hypothetical protein RND71_018753 [Anisodus tanguticus]|uniref:Uncharacterized protein n=1 Tax=Anisodus tanguticus TaxID=243964 RepID=A0AAE1S658_9SOLA|nr:hypothetical protein RND71_018753 [Anisodus tanguticus]
MHYRRIDSSECIVHWYRKDTYLQAYSNFIQHVPSMNMWPESSNSKIEPLEVKKISGRPRRCRKKEIGEVRRVEKLTKRGIAMTCSGCKSSTHNIRSCPSRPRTIITRAAATTRASPKLDPSMRKYSKPPAVKGQTVVRTARATALANAPTPPTVAANAPTATCHSRRKYTKPHVPSRPKAPTKVNASQQSSTGSTRKSSVLDTQEASTSMRGSRSKYKRPRVVRQGVFVADSEYRNVNVSVTKSFWCCYIFIHFMILTNLNCNKECLAAGWYPHLGH